MDRGPNAAKSIVQFLPEALLFAIR